VRRRHLVLIGLLSGSGVAAAQSPQPSAAPEAGTVGEASPARFSVPLELLQSEVAKRYPVRYPVAGLVNLDLSAPRLSLLPEQNRLRAVMPVSAAGAALSRTQQGSFTVDFALRYEHADRSLRAHQLKVYRLRFPDLAPEALEMLNTYAPPLAERSLREVVLYQLQPKETAMADLLGLRPGRINVTPQGLLVELLMKPL
jgi:hypothetical protein